MLDELGSHFSATSWICSGMVFCPTWSVSNEDNAGGMIYVRGLSPLPGCHIEPNLGCCDWPSTLLDCGCCCCCCCCNCCCCCVFWPRLLNNPPVCCCGCCGCCWVLCPRLLKRPPLCCCGCCCVFAPNPLNSPPPRCCCVLWPRLPKRPPLCCCGCDDALKSLAPCGGCEDDPNRPPPP